MYLVGAFTLLIGPTIVITNQEMVCAIIHAITIVEKFAAVTGPKHTTLKEQDLHCVCRVQIGIT